MAEEEAARAFLDLQTDGSVSGAAAVSWVAGHPRFAALSRPARAKAWSVADSNDSGALDDDAISAKSHGSYFDAEGEFSDAPALVIVPYHDLVRGVPRRSPAAHERAFAGRAGRAGAAS